MKRIDIQPSPRQFNECLYCSNTLEGADNEHLFLQAWGGVSQASHLICTDCNRAHSKSIDPSFSGQVKIIRNTWAIGTERDPRTPEVRSTTQGYKIGSYGQPLSNRDPELKAELDEDGKLSVQVHNMKSRTNTKKLLRDFDAIEGQIGRPLTDTQKKALNEAKTEVVYNRENVKVFREDNILMKPELQYRCIANTAMKVLFYYAPQLARHDRFDAIRSFIKNGGDYFSHACIADTHPNVAFFQNRFGSIKANSVEIYFSPQINKVIAVVTILSTIKRAIVLADRLSKLVSPHQLSILRVLEPLNHSGMLTGEVLSIPLDLGVSQLIKLEDRKPDEAYLTEEIKEFVESQYKLEPAIANLLAKLKNEVLSPNLLGREAEIRIFELIENFIDEYLRRSQMHTSREVIRETLKKCGLDVLIPRVVSTAQYTTAEQLLQELLPPIYCTIPRLSAIADTSVTS